MRILTIEDEARIARRVERMTALYFEGNAVITICDSLRKGMGFLENEVVDILLLDLQLNGRDGFEVLQSVTSRSFQTIGVSANTENAMRAFELGVLDFVSKPFDQERLALALVGLQHQKRTKRFCPVYFCKKKRKYPAYRA